ncbi:hypothetical protein IWX49DRAFT_52999 [Phyllosticta citricarpa]|uniref:Secreted protein n=1 Tax=Phyllosticta citricarpa TaxID=55181 RepID=A0ABR1MPN6_9PEZI
MQSRSRPGRSADLMWLAWMVLAGRTQQGKRSLANLRLLPKKSRPFILGRGTMNLPFGLAQLRDDVVFLRHVEKATEKEWKSRKRCQPLQLAQSRVVSSFPRGLDFFYSLSMPF